jgi:hypothetical protein
VDIAAVVDGAEGVEGPGFLKALVFSDVSSQFFQKDSLGMEGAWRRLTSRVKGERRARE